MKWRLIAQGKPDALTLWDAFAEEISNNQFNHLDVAVAYATLQGVKALEMALGGMKQSSRWVVGLDDAISQPEAIEYLLTLQGAQVRVASMLPGKRFHAKLYCSWSTEHKDKCVTAIGSGNMTLNGLVHNAETAVLLTAETREEAIELKKQWRAMWNLGNKAKQDTIDSYRNIYKAARKQRKKIAALGVAPREPKPNASVKLGPRIAGDPKKARLAWLEAGSPSAGGRDLEFPRDIIPFFELRQSPTLKKFRMRDGQVFTLRFTERMDNQMWRLMFTRDAIHAAVGRQTMRPLNGNNRSDLAVVFRKLRDAADYDVKMVLIGSPEHAGLISRSRSAQALYRTRDPGGRNFGLA